MLSVFFLSFFIGMRHALEADHIAAVATVTNQKSKYSAIGLGLSWGIGHTLTLFLFGGIVLWMDTTVSESIAKSLEFIVGIMLLLLGLDVIRRLYRDKVHYHFHQHSEGDLVSPQHFHAHSHRVDTQHNHKHLQIFSIRALFIGLMHGLAGSAALILLVLSSITNPWLGMLYIFLFGVGTMVGMAIVTVVISYPLRKASEKGITWLHNSLQLAIGLSTIGLGLIIMLENV